MNRTICIAAVMALLLTGCAADANFAPMVLEKCADPSGFWLGLWHGMIAPITLVISLLNDNVSVYEVCNNGGWYDFGFVLGVGGSGSSSAAAGSRARR